MLAGNLLTGFSMIGTLVITLSSMMLKNDPTYLKNLIFTPQDFKSMFGHLWTLCIKIKRLIDWNKSYMMSINYTRAYFRLRVRKNLYEITFSWVLLVFTLLKMLHCIDNIYFEHNTLLFQYQIHTQVTPTLKSSKSFPNNILFYFDNL